MQCVISLQNFPHIKLKINLFYSQLKWNDRRSKLLHLILIVTFSEYKQFKLLKSYLRCRVFVYALVFLNFGVRLASAIINHTSSIFLICSIQAVKQWRCYAIFIRHDFLIFSPCCQIAIDEYFVERFGSMSQNSGCPETLQRRAVT